MSSAIIIKNEAAEAANASIYTSIFVPLSLILLSIDIIVEATKTSPPGEFTYRFIRLTFPISSKAFLKSIKYTSVSLSIVCPVHQSTSFSKQIAP